MRIDEIPYFSHIPRDGRVLLAQPWYDHASNEWHLYAELAKGNFIRMQMAGFVSGPYYSSAAANSGDLRCPLATFIAQHLSLPPTVRALYCLLDDLHLLSASIEKLELFAQHNLNTAATSFLVESEIEYQFTLVRAMYDLLQKVVKSVASMLCTRDGALIVQALPDSFASAALQGDRLRTVDELQAKYSLPEQLATFYVSHGPFFQQLRAIRVSIEHHGKTDSNRFSDGSRLRCND